MRNKDWIKYFEIEEEELHKMIEEILSSPEDE